MTLGLAQWVSNESLEVLVSLDESNGAWGWELHAGLAKSITGGEVELWVNLNRDNSLPSLYTSSGSNVLSESTAHSLSQMGASSANAVRFMADWGVEGVPAMSLVSNPIMAGWWLVVAIMLFGKIWQSK